MNKYEITKRIENFAPPELAEKWDCSGWLVETKRQEIKKIMLCLTVTDDIITQAREQNCDMIISHHPLFLVPLDWNFIDIYCAHTNLDRTNGGTTDTLIQKLSSEIDASVEIFNNSNDGFLRYINTEISLEKFIAKLKKFSPNLRYVNNNNLKTLKKIAFCAGSGFEFIQEAFENGADALVSGDLKFHVALESPIVLFDIGHFESEILVLPVFEQLIGQAIEIVYAEEKSPFRNV
jgi:dinuclear metal center YbgI/SA1388 family protein